jgi:TRAP-type C4-dicarboxylate transport system permease large subunit
VVTAIGIDPVHFGVIMVFNLCIGIWSPPSGSALFVGCSLAGVSLAQVFRPLIPFFVVMTLANLIVTFVPWLSLALPNYFLGH